jgi:hypothetical protein
VLFSLSPQEAVGRWSTAAIHDTVAAIARQPQYATPLRRSLFGRALAFVIDWFSDVIRLFHGSREFRLVVIAATALVVLAVVGRIVISRQLDVLGRRGDGRGGTVRGAPRDFWAISREFAAGADYAAACHALYAAVIDGLARNGSVKFHSSKTSGDYVLELRRNGSPAVQNFRTFARLFDRSVYGTTTADRDDYERLMRAAESAASIQTAA